ncbi:Protein N-acetyltransferase, RimJ/RimL family [Paracoccus isoporae]|uniref:Protein N-acetyltransferase, RimJ/RimL family n=1 Tax=Paracoccus isoporae TaxID=591205 RepID=A0A1G7BS21_9RHOB|nr:GNAT family N-acetyltransferase [Paracoccus isoporae]SDE29166.1 Protein N-acetyltransferase, RimJ/RimL family [Paracoccus isoporae]
MPSEIATIQIEVPILETKRLILREPRNADWEAVRAFSMSDRSRHVGGPFNEWQAWSSLVSVAGHWAIRGYGMWTVEDKATGGVTGRIGIINHIDWPEPELGWQIFEGFEGKGLAYEAAMAARNHAQGSMGMGPLISQIAHDNTRSRRLAERMGAVIESEGEVRGTPCLIYRHPAGVA